MCRFSSNFVPTVRVGAVFVESYGVISCFAPAGLSGETMAVEVSLNAQQFSTQGASFQYHDVPSVSIYSPSSGPSSSRRPSR